MIYSNDLEKVFKKWPDIQNRMIEFLSEERDLPIEEFTAQSTTIQGVKSFAQKAILQTLVGFLVRFPHVNGTWLVTGKGKRIAQIEEIQNRLKELEEEVNEFHKIIQSNEAPLLRFQDGDKTVIPMQDTEGVTFFLLKELPPTDGK